MALQPAIPQPRQRRKTRRINSTSAQGTQEPAFPSCSSESAPPSSDGAARPDNRRVSRLRKREKIFEGRSRYPRWSRSTIHPSATITATTTTTTRREYHVIRRPLFQAHQKSCQSSCARDHASRDITTRSAYAIEHDAITRLNFYHHQPPPPKPTIITTTTTSV